MTKEEQQKIYNAAFDISLFLTLYGLFFQRSLFILIYFFLGYLTKKGVKYAPLLFLFIYSMGIILQIINLMLSIASVYPDTAKANAMLYSSIIPAFIIYFVYKRYINAYRASKARISDDDISTAIKPSLNLKGVNFKRIITWIFIIAGGYALLYYAGIMLLRLMSST